MTSAGESSNPSENDLYALDLQMDAAEILGNQVRSFAIAVSDDGIVIRGSCDSHHIKQVAQEVVRRCTSRRIVSNLIVVRELPID